ncbi:MAG: peptidylprolyl isomerase [Flavobacteriales bacterium]|nr:peptidylprolyl isomerase [Flavobacteriales bacterium]
MRTMRSAWWIECLALSSTLLSAPTVLAQPEGKFIDGLIGVVGREVVLYSELIARVEQEKQNGYTGTDLTCRAVEDLLVERLMLDQARIDSITVDEGQVQAELDRRIRYFVMQLGSQEKLEEFYGKTITEIKADFHDQVQEQLMVQNMQQQISGGIEVTPRQVEEFYKTIPKDSLPYINVQVEYGQILRKPRVSDAEDLRVRKKIEEFREQVVKGTKEFCTVAVLYSEDPGSASNCGELGLVPTGVMVPEFDAVALSLKEGEVSQVFKTDFGYHFMQLIERRGEQYNARHVLIKPQVSNADMLVARNFLDSLAAAIRDGRTTFSDAAADHSDDEESRSNGGVMVDPATNSALWATGNLDQQTFFVLDKLEVQEISQPVVVTAQDGEKSYRLLKLVRRTEPHVADLKQDYQLLKEAAEGDLRNRMVQDWLDEKLAGTYVRVHEAYSTCAFQNAWSWQTSEGP